MSNKHELKKAKQTLNDHGELVFSMIHDAGQQDWPLARMWIALASMIQEVESGDKYSSGLNARIRSLER